MRHKELHWQTVDGLQLYAQAWQPESPPQVAVCLVHGQGEHSSRYRHVAAALTQAGHALLAFDLRGHGRSQGPRGHTPSYQVLLEDIDLLLQEAERRFPSRPCFLYGHSLGGNLVLNYALRRQPQLAGVISTSPLLCLAFTIPVLKRALARVMDVLWPSFTQPSGLEIAALSRDPAVVRAYETDPLVHDLCSTRLFNGFLQAGLWALEHAAAFSLPLLLMHGSADRITSVEASRDFADRVRSDCTLKLWAGLYHETHNEPEKEDVLNYMIQWLDQHGGTWKGEG